MKKMAILRVAPVVAIMLSSFAPTAQATMGLRLFDSLGNCVEVTNPGAAATGCGGSNISGGGVINSSSINPNGTVSLNGSVGVWTFNVTTGQTKPFLGSALQPEMDLNTVSTSNGAGTLTIQWSDTDFLLNPGNLVAAGGGTTNKVERTPSIAFDTFASSDNTLYGTAGGSSTLLNWPPFPGCPAVGLCSFNGSVGSATGVPAAPYSLMEQLVFKSTGPITVSGDFGLTVVPEPASVALLGGVLLFTATALRRRFKRV